MVRFAVGILIALIVAYFCGVLTIVVANSASPDFAFMRGFSVQVDEQAQGALDGQLNVQFPATASNFYRADLSGKATWMRFDINPNDISGLFSAFMTCDFPLRDGYLPNFEFGHVLNGGQQLEISSWWQPAGDASFRAGVGGECTGSDYRMFRMFADQSNNQFWQVFMEVVAA
jgi:hypothetical protein